MAPLDRMSHEEFEQQLKDVIQDFYQIMVQVSTYDTTGRPSRDVLSNEVKTLSRSLQALHVSASSPHGRALPSVPPELLEYVENGRNPDIYTREFVELVRRGNQLIRGKICAFTAFRDVLAEQMAQAMPELREDVERVLEATGGRPLGSSSSAEGGDGSTTAGVGARRAGAETASTAGG
ncbi:Mediator of RNA polymerase II transcription subunit 10 [Tolypocladium capitatum]|uniref:Mediator of RNA polymerase II transcription subunit 10 n=1 Tax=Tolypocladium capitatum TaxID=45235 RepID=A0A2K3Q024_9HYPO|nr:Mediator of RNA polymerase II transcription subunit 10 [Tolypocladium capitatum]